MNLNKKILFPLLGLFLVTVVMIVILRWEGRIWFSASGTIRFWVGDAWGPENSQHFTDPYSFSHALHGILFLGHSLYIAVSAFRLGEPLRPCRLWLMHAACAACNRQAQRLQTPRGKFLQTI